MFDTLLIINLFLLALTLVCLLTLRLKINIKHVCLFFHSPFTTDIKVFFEIPTPPRPTFILIPPFIKFNKNLQPLPIYFDPPPLPRLLGT